MSSDGTSCPEPATDRPWWDARPGVWQRELDAFADAEMELSQAVDHQGNRTVETTTILAGTAVTLTVTYPSTYPWFPPTVKDATGQLAHLPRHRDPHQGVLCLIEPEAWRINSTAAELITSQLPILLTYQRHDPGGDLEDSTPVAAINHGIYADQARILIDSGTMPPKDADAGYVRWNYVGSGSRLTGAMAAFSSATGQVLAMSPEALTRPFPLEATGRWIRHDTRLPLNWTAAELWTAISERLPPRPAEPSDATTRGPRPELDLVAILTRDEVAHRVEGWVWIVLVHYRPDRRHRPQLVAVQCVSAGPTDLARRTPDAALLPSKRVLLVGAGALGGRLAVTLVAAGLGALDLVDPDSVEPVNVTRQVVDITHIGMSKVRAVALAAIVHNPYAHITRYATRVGTAHDAGQHSRLQQSIGQADLVIDATAEPATTRYLAHHARANSTDFLHVSATPGVWGGSVIHLSPAPQEPCWACVEHYRHDPTMPTPPADPHGILRPDSCSSATFTGHGADLDTIASHAANLARIHLSHDGIGDQPGSRSQLHVATLRDRRGSWAPATWAVTTLTCHQGCPLHSPDRHGIARSGGKP